MTTRSRLLLLLRKHPGITVTELAAELGLTGMGVRRHLDALAADGLVERTVVPRAPVGRPPNGWRLSATGHGAVPPLATTPSPSQLLEDLCEQVGDEGVDVVLRRRSEKLAVQYRDELADAADPRRAGGGAGPGPRPGRLPGRVAPREGDVRVLIENNCAVHRVAERFPAVCAMELALFRRVLGPDVEVTRVAHTMAGDAVCSYCIRPRPADALLTDLALTDLGRCGRRPRWRPRCWRRRPRPPTRPRSSPGPTSGSWPTPACATCSRPRPPAVAPEVYEILAGACGVTFFVWVQHHAPVRLLAAGPWRRRPHAWPSLRSGELLGGVAFAYLRRPGPPAVVARRRAGRSGGRRRGPVGHVVGPGRHVRGRRPPRRTEVVYLPAGRRPRRPPAVRASAPLALAAMNASSTVRLALRRPGRPRRRRHLGRSRSTTWQARDRVATAQPNPAVFGMARHLLPPAGRRRPAARRRAGRVPGAVLRPGRRRPDRRRPPRPAWSRPGPGAATWPCGRRRPWSWPAAGGRCCAANPAQRLLREAAFFTIQAQTPSSAPPPSPASVACAGLTG